MEELIKVSIPLPKGSGKNKNKIASLNEIIKWHWSAINKVKFEYKSNLKDWYIPKNQKEPQANMTIEFQLRRHNNRVLDSDNIGIIIKWTIDTIKEQNWLIDDNQVTYTVIPSVLDNTVLDTTIDITAYITNKT